MVRESASVGVDAREKRLPGVSRREAGLILDRQIGQRLAKRRREAVSYTHLTLPTNREV